MSLKRKAEGSVYRLVELDGHVPERLRHEVEWLAKGKTVELNGTRDGVRAHVLPEDPIADVRFRYFDR